VDAWGLRLCHFQLIKTNDVRYALIGVVYVFAIKARSALIVKGKIMSDYEFNCVATKIPAAHEYDVQGRSVLYEDLPLENKNEPEPKPVGAYLESPVSFIEEHRRMEEIFFLLKYPSILIQKKRSPRPDYRGRQFRDGSGGDETQPGKR